MMGMRALLVLNNALLIAFAGMIVLESLINALTLAYFYRRSGESIRSWRFDSNRVCGLYSRKACPIFFQVLPY